MIAIEQDGYTHLYHALTRDEVACFLDLATTSLKWELGRQNGGYYKADISMRARMRGPSEDLVRDTVFRAFYALDQSERVILTENWDAWLIFYPPGSFIPWHHDEVTTGRHIRFNATIKAAEDGGGLCIEGEEGPIRPAVGDALIFCSSEKKHKVKTVTRGSQLVLSIGTTVRPPTVG